MLKIKNLKISIKDSVLLDDVNLEVKKGQIHAIMGPRHSGKSSLVHAILGNSILDISGSIAFDKKSIIKKTIEERCVLGIFTTFQFLPLVDGITNFELTKVMLKSHNDSRNNNEFEKDYKFYVKKLGLSSNHGHKIVNDETMTATECKKNELLHMFLLDPNLIVLDELDKDIESDELESVASNIVEFVGRENKAAIVFTNNTDFLDKLMPTHVSILINGQLQSQHDPTLYKRIIKDDDSYIS